jgi:nitroreductase
LRPAKSGAEIYQQVYGGLPVSDEQLNELQELIATRKTAQRFEPEPIPEGAVRRALKCAITAPNHKLTNPWRFVRVGEETRAALEELYIELKSEKRELGEDEEKRLRRKVGDPPKLVAVVQELADDDFRRREDYAAVACAVQNLSLSLWSEGIYSKWNTGSLTRQDETYDWLNVDPTSEEIVGFIWIGYIRDDYEENPKPPRDPLDEVVERVE